jgi:phosphoribosylglycinamide formyltransferase 1
LIGSGARQSDGTRSVVILISGRGSNMLALVEDSRRADCPYSVDAVFSDRADAAGLESARRQGIAVTALPFHKGSDRADYDRQLAAAIRERDPRLVVLAGFMRILSAEFVAMFEGKIMNIHPSLLPKYPGLHTHRRALEAKDAEHGVTVHFVTAQLDAGPAIVQARVAVAPDDTESSLFARVQLQEHRILPLAVRWFCEGRLRCAQNQAWLDGRVLREPVQYAGQEPAP